MQLFGTRFHVTLGGLQLRVGISVEDQSDPQSSEPPEAAYYVAPFARHVNGERQEVVR